MMKTILKIVLPLLIIAAGLVGAAFVRQQKPTTKAKDTRDRALPVEVIAIRQQDVTMRIAATGHVVAAREIRLAPEINGRIIRVNPNLVPGTRLDKGAFIARIDPRDYRIALVQEQGRMQQAQLDYQLETTRGQIAQKEWELLGGGLQGGAETSDLALRKPQMAVAEQQKTTVENSVAQAKLNLNRTEIRAPFAGIVLAKNVDVGQYVNPTTPLLHLMGTDELWVDVSVPVGQLRAIDIPGVNTTAEEGSTATIAQRVGDQTISRQGAVIRLQGALDAKSRTARLLLSVPDPFGSDAGLPLLAGAYVQVEIQGHPLRDVFPVPREALQEGRFVWRATTDNLLERTDVTVLFSDRDTAVLQGELQDGDRLIVSPLAFPVSGMHVAPQERQTADVP